ncbi:hypothetical protein [Micromonospora sp. NPDC005324]|uniref:hypothetical protein n=1 Tax=Micromonospora sp. NPDC005324 TaxID=3157033 RepID=UPI0033A8D28D
MTGVDADALDAAVCRWLLSRAVLTGAGRRVIAVDGQTLRGSGPTRAQVHLPAALDQAEQIVLAQINVAQQPRGQISGNSRGDGASWQVTADEIVTIVVEIDVCRVEILGEMGDQFGFLRAALGVTRPATLLSPPESPVRQTGKRRVRRSLRYSPSTAGTLVRRRG